MFSCRIGTGAATDNVVGVINVRLEEEEDVLGDFRLPGDVIPE